MQDYNWGPKSENIQKAVSPEPINLGGWNLVCNLFSYRRNIMNFFNKFEEPSATGLCDFTWNDPYCTSVVILVIYLDIRMNISLKYLNLKLVVCYENNGFCIMGKLYEYFCLQLKLLNCFSECSQIVQRYTNMGNNHAKFQPCLVIHSVIFIGWNVMKTKLYPQTVTRNFWCQIFSSLALFLEGFLGVGIWCRQNFSLKMQ